MILDVSGVIMRIFEIHGLLALAATLVVTTAAAQAPAPTLEPGLWALKIITTTNGKTEQTENSEQCLGDELKDLGSYFSPKLEDVQAECKRLRQPAGDKQISHTLECKGANFTMNAATLVNIESARSFSAALRLDSKAAGESAQVAAKIEGRRIGPCRK
jgi:Protein of unknown function (DUF3617)